MKSSLRQLAGLATFVVLMWLGACAQMSSSGVVAPKSFLQSAAAAQISVTTVKSLALTLLNSGQITVDRAKKARDAANQGNAAIDAAVALYVTSCPPTPVIASAPAASVCASPVAETALERAIAILTAAQALLPPPKGV